MRKLALIFALLLCAAPSSSLAACSNTSLGNGWTCVQSKFAECFTNKTSCAVAFGANVTAGNILFVAGAGFSTAPAGCTISVADDKGNSWAGATQLSNSTYNDVANVFYAIANAGSGGAKPTVTVSTVCTETNRVDLFMVEISGGSSTPFDRSAGVAGTSTSITATNAGEVVIGFNWNSSAVPTIGSGYTSLDGTSVGLLEGQSFLTSGSKTLNFATSGNGPLTIGMSFKANAAAPAKPCTIALLGAGPC